MNPSLLWACIVLWQTSGSPTTHSKIDLVNTLGEPLTIWFWPELKKEWTRPALFLPRHGTAAITLATKGKYYIVIRDQANRDEHLGWFDFHMVLKKAPDAELLLDSLYTTVMKEQRYTVCKPVYEEVVKDGRPQRVCKMVQEEVVKQVPVRVREIQLKVRTQGKTRPLSEFLNESK